MSPREIVLATLMVLLLVVAPASVTILKGHVLLFVLGFLIGLVWIVAAFRLARPGSWWAHRFYDDAKVRRAAQRYEGVETSTAPAAS